MITVQINGIALQLQTDSTLFSPNQADPGTLAMLSCVSLHENDKLLDLGCGYGLVGIYSAKIIGESRITMTDINPLAIRIAGENATVNQVPGIRILQSDGFSSIDDTGYTLILSNPPYHTDFSVAKHFIEKGFNRLTLGGKMIMVTKRKEWYKNKFIAIFGGVRINETNGYFVFTAEKRNNRYGKS